MGLKDGWWELNGGHIYLSHRLGNFKTGPSPRAVLGGCGKTCRELRDERKWGCCRTGKDTKTALPGTTSITTSGQWLFPRWRTFSNEPPLGSWTKWASQEIGSWANKLLVAGWTDKGGVWNYFPSCNFNKASPKPQKGCVLHEGKCRWPDAAGKTPWETGSTGSTFAKLAGRPWGTMLPENLFVWDRPDFPGRTTRLVERSGLLACEHPEIFDAVRSTWGR